MMKFLELRTRARARLGPAFDIRTFHAAALDEGSLPLSVLAQRIERHIERTAAAQPGSAASASASASPSTSPSASASPSPTAGTGRHRQ
jgi:hypothetical protein